MPKALVIINRRILIISGFQLNCIIRREISDIARHLSGHDPISVIVLNVDLGVCGGYISKNKVCYYYSLF